MPKRILVLGSKAVAKAVGDSSDAFANTEMNSTATAKATDTGTSGGAIAKALGSSKAAATASGTGTAVDSFAQAQCYIEGGEYRKLGICGRRNLQRGNSKSDCHRYEQSGGVTNL